MRSPLRKLTPGTVIEVHGHIHNNTKRFSINLETNQGDIALHVNPRFDVGNVVFNSLRSGKWENEECQQWLPVGQGQDFMCMILVEKMDYKVAFNGRHFHSFKHRILYSLVEVLSVEGGITLRTVEQRPPDTTLPPMEASPATVDPKPLQLSFFGTPPMEGVAVALPVPPTLPHPDVFNPSTPCVCKLQSGCYPGMLVYISGRPHVEPDKFNVDLCCGPPGAPGMDVAFHWNPRFRSKTVVRNAFLKGAWGTEELGGRGFPYSAGVHFDMIVQVLHDRINVAVNGQHYAEFHHRLQPITVIDHLSIAGDVLIASVRFR